MKVSRQQLLELRPLADRIGVELAALVAVVQVESAGVIFAQVADLEVPLIRWEGHYFHRLLKGEKLERAVKEGLAHPKAGKIKNPSSQTARYAMLNKAAKIDATAAYSSISIGVGQVMGAHWKSLGFESPLQMLKIASRGLAGQVELMIRFIQKNDLADELRRKDWSAYARGYNGPAYAKNRYHIKMAEAYHQAVRFLGGDESPVPTGMLRMGSMGAGVREVQRLLVRAGFTVKVDGDFGPSTKQAVMAFQKSQGLKADGVVGPATNAKLLKFKDPSEDLGEEKVLDLPEAKSAAVGAGGGLSIAVGAEKLNEIADKMVASEAMQTVASGLYAVAGIMIIGALVWGVYGYVKSRRTYEGVS